MTWQQISIMCGNIRLERDTGITGWLDLFWLVDNTHQLLSCCKSRLLHTPAYISMCNGGNISHMNGMLTWQWICCLQQWYFWQSDQYIDRAVTWGERHVCHSIKSQQAIVETRNKSRPRVRQQNCLVKLTAVWSLKNLELNSEYILCQRHKKSLFTVLLACKCVFRTLM